MFEISTRRTGISAKDLQRILGFGSYETAWTWLHKLRAALVREDREPLGPFVQIDEALVGGRGSPNKELVLVAAEPNGRVRLAHAANNDAATLKRFADGQIAPQSAVTTDGHAGYNAASLGARPHEGIVQTKAERTSNDVVQACHWSTSNLKRWLLGTHAGAVSEKHRQAYLRIRLPLQPPQNEGCRSNCRPRHRNTRHARGAADALKYPIASRIRCGPGVY